MKIIALCHDRTDKINYVLVINAIGDDYGINYYDFSSKGDKHINHWQWLHYALWFCFIKVGYTYMVSYELKAYLISPMYPVLKYLNPLFAGDIYYDAFVA